MRREFSNWSFSFLLLLEYHGINTYVCSHARQRVLSPRVHISRLKLFLGVTHARMHALICSYICILLMSPSSLVGRRSIVVLYHLFQHRSSSPPRSLAVRPHKPHLASLSATDMTLPNPILHYPANVPPVAALVAARICGVDLTEKPEKDWSSAASATLVFQDKAKLRGEPQLS